MHIVSYYRAHLTFFNCVKLLGVCPSLEFWLRCGDFLKAAVETMFSEAVNTTNLTFKITCAVIPSFLFISSYFLTLFP